MDKVTAIFDIGKTNKKYLLFNEKLEVVFEQEKKFEEISDDDGYPCDDLDSVIKWMKNCLNETLSSKKYDIFRLNFSTYGATLVYLDKEGNRVAPVYNYLKPVPDNYFDEFYNKYGGKDEFSRQTASPALNMLNSGLQAYWLKKEKPHYWEKVSYILHLPQYLSFLFTGKITTEYTSIGCHTALWNFDIGEYHTWMKDENIQMPSPVKTTTSFVVRIEDTEIETGTGIHDSSASLLPYYNLSGGNFILLSTGTWAINLNPFNKKPLTKNELEQDCLCYLGINKQQVKASRLFMGHIHDVNSEILAEYYNSASDFYKSVTVDKNLLSGIFKTDKRILFPEGIPENYYINKEALNEFPNISEAYSQLIYELSYYEAESIRLIHEEDEVKQFFISGGFVRNELFIYYLKQFFPNHKIITAEIENSSALGAALVFDM